MANGHDPYASLYRSLLANRNEAIEPEESGPVTSAFGYAGPTPFATWIAGVPPSSIAKHGLDLTDPSVDPGTTELSPAERVVRNIRYFGKTFGASIVSPLGSGGIELAQIEGELAEPRSPEEKVVSFAAPLLAAIIQTLPLGGAGAITKGAPAAAPFRSLAQPVSGGVMSLMGPQLARFAAGAGSKVVGGEVVPKLTAQKLSEAVAGVGLDVGFGLGIGGTEIAAHEALTGEKVNAAGMLATTVGGAMLLGGLFRAPTILNSARAAYRLGTASEGQIFPIAPGTVVNNKVASYVNGQLRWRYTPEHPNFDPKRPTKFAKLTPEDTQEAARATLTNAKAQLEKVPEGQAAVAAAENASPATTGLPQGVDPGELNALAAMYYRDRVLARVHKIGPDKAARELEDVRAMWIQEDLPLDLRKQAGGYIMAMEKALGEPASLRFSGMLPLEIEMQAVELIRRELPRRGSPAMYRYAETLRAEGYPDLADRVRTLLDKKLPEKLSEKLYTRLEKASTRRNLGYETGSKAIYEGKSVTVVGKPEYGIATVQPTLGGEIVQVAVEDLIPIPSAGKTIQLKDGKLAVVQAVKEEKGRFLATLENGEQKWFNFSKIEELSDDPAIAARQAAIIKRLGLKVKQDDLQEIPPVPAVTQEGESVTVSKVGKDAAEVSSKSGTRVVAKSELKPVLEQEGMITSFEPRKLPAPGSKILFVEVPETRVGAFEKSFRQGELSDEFGSVAHVLPQEPTEGVRQYAVQIASENAPRRNYLPEGRAAVDALGGKATVTSYASPVAMPAGAIERIYSIPEELQAAAIRPAKSLSKMSQEEQTAYLKHLIVFNENIDSGVSKAATKARAARANIKQSAQKGNFSKVNAELDNLADANLEAAEAKMASEVRAAKGPTKRFMQGLAAVDKEALAKQKLAEEGFTPELEKLIVNSLQELPASAKGRVGESLVWVSPTTGERLFVSKKVHSVLMKEARESPAVRRTETYYQAEAFDAASAKLPELSKDFTTPEGVTAYAIRAGFKPSLSAPVMSKHWKHPEFPELILSFSETAGGTFGSTTATRALGVDEILVQQQRQIMARIGMASDDGVRTMISEEVGRNHFGSLAEAEAWAREKGWNLAKEGPSVIKAFNALPAVERITTAEQARDIDDALRGIIEDYMQTTVIPEEVSTYANGFAQRFYDLTGRAPFEPMHVDSGRDLRAAVGAVMIRDLQKFARASTGEYRMPSDMTVFFSKVLDANEPTMLAAKRAKKVLAQLSKQREWMSAWLKQGDMEPKSLGTKHMNLARVKTTGQVVQVTFVDLPGDAVRVRFPGTGEEIEMAKSALELTRFNPQDFVDYRTAQLIHEGRYAEFFGQSEPKMGFGAVEQALGLFGSTNRFAVREGFSGQAKELIGKLSFDPKTKQLSGENHVLDQLFELHRRSIYLDAIESKLGALGEKASEKFTFSNIVTDNLKRIDPVMEKSFRRAAYTNQKARLGDTPFAELQARAFSGYLSQKNEAILQEFAKANGLPSGLPATRLVIDLLERKLLDPRMANIKVSLNREAGFLRIGHDLGMDGELPQISIKVPRVNDIMWEINLGIPSKVVARHPMGQLVLDQIYNAQSDQIRHNRLFREFQLRIRHLRYVDDDVEKVADALIHAFEQEKSVFDILPDKLKPLASEIQMFFKDSKKSLVKNFLRRDIQPVPFDPTNVHHVEWAAERGITPDRFETIAYILPKDKHEVNKVAVFAGERASAWTEDEMSSFTALMDKYQTAAVLPEGTPDKFKEVFDYWQHWGIDNYWPLVHEGRQAVMVERGGKDAILAFAETGYDAHMIAKQLIREGKIGAAEKVKIEDLSGGQVLDDIIVMYSKSTADIKNAMSFLAQQNKIDPDEVQTLLMRTDRPEEFGVRPGQPHAKRRVRNLQPAFKNRMREFAVYNARVGRMDYRWQLLKALESLEDINLDRALSEGAGLPLINSGEFTELRKYLVTKLKLASGEQSGAEKAADKLYMFLDYLGQVPKAQLNKYFNGEEALPMQAFYQKYASRRWSASMVGFQSWMRLSASGGSTLANTSQYFVTTAPMLVEPGYSLAKSTDLVFRSWIRGGKLAFKYMARKELTKEEQVISDILDRSGIALQASKHSSGMGRSFGDITEGAPLPFGVSKSEHAWNMFQYYTMVGFNGAEKTNRFATAIAAIERTMQKRGTTLLESSQQVREEAAEAARKLVRETQFLYDEVSLPSALATMGPIGRVLFQFKPFVLNMLSYEKDMFTKTFVDHAPGAGRQLAAHLGMLGVFGGLVGLAYHPAATLVGSMADLATGENPFERLSAKQRESRRRGQSLEENLLNSVNYKADDLLYYGLPGIVGLSMGQRVGVSGQELMFSLKDATGLAGPHGSIYLDIVRAFNQYLKQPGTGGGKAGALVGAIAPSFLPRGVRGEAGALATIASQVRELPFIRAGTAGIGAAIGSSLTNGNSFKEFFRNSDEGRRIMLRDVPTWLRNAELTWELFDEGGIRDINGRPMNIPSTDKTQEGIMTALGLPTIRKEENSAYLGFLSGVNENQAAARANYVNRIAKAWMEGDYESAYAAVAEAIELGIEISDESIERELESMTDERLDTIRRRMPKDVRFRTP